MIYVDWGYAGKVATVGVLAVAAVVVATRKLVEFAVYCDMEGQALQRDRDHMPPEDMDHYRVVGDDQEQIRALRQIDDALDAMDEPDEHERVRYVG